MERKDEGLDRTQLEREHSKDPNANPGNISEDREPHHTLNSPAEDPDPTEFPDPYDRRDDPRAPDRDEAAPRSPSTSDPHPEDFDDVKPAKGDEDVR
jgi:hypothetical protein